MGIHYHLKLNLIALTAISEIDGGHSRLPRMVVDFRKYWVTRSKVPQVGDLLRSSFPTIHVE
jgi:hypothetical protein